MHDSAPQKCLSEITLVSAKEKGGPHEEDRFLAFVQRWWS